MIKQMILKEMTSQKIYKKVRMKIFMVKDKNIQILKPQVKLRRQLQIQMEMTPQKFIDLMTTILLSLSPKQML